MANVYNIQGPIYQNTTLEIMDNISDKLDEHFYEALHRFDTETHAQEGTPNISRNSKCKIIIVVMMVTMAGLLTVYLGVTLYSEQKGEL